MVVTTDDDPVLAERVSEEVGRWIWDNKQRFDVNDGPWLKVSWAGNSEARAISYVGNIDDATHDHSVGCAIAKHPDGPLRNSHLGAWPVGDGFTVRYFEITVESSGDRGFIAVGWARPDYPRKCRQPGWDNHTYGYHGDECARSAALPSPRP